jgi:pimeloyl-ACP methyl ester carboxylesterase
MAAPVTLACGDVGPHFDETMLRGMAARMKRARIEVLPGVGHFGPMEDPARVAASIIAGMDAWE